MDGGNLKAWAAYDTTVPTKARLGSKYHFFFEYLDREQ